MEAKPSRTSEPLTAYGEEEDEEDVAVIGGRVGLMRIRQLKGTIYLEQIVSSIHQSVRRMYVKFGSALTMRQNAMIAAPIPRECRRPIRSMKNMAAMVHATCTVPSIPEASKLSSLDVPAPMKLVGR